MANSFSKLLTELLVDSILFTVSFFFIGNRLKISSKKSQLSNFRVTTLSIHSSQYYYYSARYYDLTKVFLAKLG